MGPRHRYEHLPLVCTPLSGYLRPKDQPCTVRYSSSSTDDTRFTFLDTGGLPKQLHQDLANPSSQLNSKLQAQLAQWVGELQDVEPILGQKEASLSERSVQQQPQMSWQSNVRLQEVRAEGPGSRAYNPKAQQQLTAVVPTRNLDKFEPVGLYMVSPLVLTLYVHHSHSICSVKLIVIVVSTHFEQHSRRPLPPSHPSSNSPSQACAVPAPTLHVMLLCAGCAPQGYVLDSKKYANDPTPAARNFLR